MTRRSVDLPQPFGPISATIPPPGIGEVDAVEDRRAAAVAASGTRTTGRAGRSRRAPGPVALPRSCAGPAERSQERRGRRVERRRRPRTAGRRRRRARGRGSIRSAMRVIAPMAAGRSGCAPIPTAPRMADPRTAVSRTAGHGDREAGHVGLDRVPERAPGRAAADPHLGDPDAGRQHRRRDVADGQRRRLDDRPGDVAAAVPEGQPGEDAARLRVPDRRPLAGEVRQEDEAVGAGRGRRGLGQERLGRDRAAEDRRRGTSRAPGPWRPSRPRRCTARPAAPASRTRPGPRAAGPSRRRTRRPTRPGRRRRRAPAARPRGSSRRRRRSRRRPGSRAAARGHRRRSSVSAADDRRPSPTGGGSRSAGTPAAATSAGSGTTWSGTSGPAATPVSRNASHSQVERYQQVAAATARFVALDPQRGRQAAERPAADAGRGGQLVGLGGRRACRGR